MHAGGTALDVAQARSFRPALSEHGCDHSTAVDGRAWLQLRTALLCLASYSTNDRFTQLRSEPLRRMPGFGVESMERHIIDQGRRPRPTTVL